MPNPCSYVTSCSVHTWDRRGDVVVSVGADIVDGDPEYFILICIKDCVGCQHLRTRGATGMVMMERFMRACRLIFDEVIVPSL